MNLYQQLALGKAKKQLANDVVDIISIVSPNYYYTLRHTVDIFAFIDKLNTFCNHR